MIKDEMTKPTDTRVEVLETRVGGIEKTLGVVLQKIDQLAAAFTSQPKHTPVVEHAKVISATVAVCTAAFSGLNYWFNQNIAPDRQRIETMYSQTADIAVMRYRLDQLEKLGVRIPDVK